jgi:hypothetical protein
MECKYHIAFLYNAMYNYNYAKIFELTASYRKVTIYAI